MDDSIKPTSPPLSIIIPAYNEEEGIGMTLKNLVAEPRLADAEIIVIDDGSTDATASIVSEFKTVQNISHRVNRGYGSAITTGIRNSTGRHIIWYDSDGQHRPEDLLRLYDKLVDENLDYCIGVRDHRSHHVGSRQLGKLILRKTVDIAAGQKVSDFNSGLRGFRRENIVGYLHLLPKGFSASTTTTLLMIQRGYIGADIDIVVQERIGKSTVKQLRDGTNTLMIILRVVLMFNPFKFFGVLGLFFTVIGSVYGLTEAISLRQGFPVFGALLIILGLQTLFFGLLADQISQMRLERLTNPELFSSKPQRHTPHKDKE
jgi:glycosyltransferase involved in cell wall biosynthesis